MFKRRVRYFPQLSEKRQQEINADVQDKTHAWQKSTKIGLWIGGCTLGLGVTLAFADETPPLQHLATDVFNANVVHNSDKVTLVGIGELALDGCVMLGLNMHRSSAREEAAKQDANRAQLDMESLN
jgi:hypothetical protein